MTNMKIFFRIALLVLAGFVVLTKSLVFAESTAILATVPSKACPQFTIISTNVPEALADNTQKVLVTVELKDCSEELLDGIPITLTTNRAAVDHADVVSSGGEVLEQGYGSGVNATTGVDGRVYFSVYTDVPGEVIITLKADYIVLLGTKNVKFLPIPFPKNISVSVVVPPVIGNLFPGYDEKDKTLPLFVPAKQQFDDAKIVNLGVDLQIPLWSFLLFALVILAIPTLSTTNILLLRHIRKEQVADTAKIEQEVEEIHEEIKAELEKPQKDEKPPTV
jgi:hypothetical protein